MHDQFDDKLSGRIRDVFENFDDGSADQGWKELRKRFPGKEERKPVAMWWWQSAAAVFLLALGTWVYLGRNTEKTYLSSNSKSRAKAPVENTAEPTIAHKPLSTTGAETVSPTRESAHINPSYSEKTNTLKGKGSYYRTFAGRRANRKFSATSDSQTNYFSNANAAQNASDEDLAVVAREEQRVVSGNPAEAPDSTAAIAKSSSVNALEKLVVADMLQKQKVKSAPTTSTQLANIHEEKTQPATSAKKTKKVSVGISAGSYMNYAKGSEGSINTGVGLLSEISLSKKLKLSTGVSLAQNTLKFSTSIPQAAAASFIASTPQEDAVPIDKGFGLITTAPVSYSLSQYNASLLGLDLPINLKYSLLKQKRELYVSAGLSSNFFIEENYTYSYQVNSGSTSSNKQEDDNTGKSRFDNFDLARMLNFSVGLEQPLTKKSRLSFEPFVKYPLGGQGARDIRFGSVGMNLKLNLNK